MIRLLSLLVVVEMETPDTVLCEEEEQFKHNGKR